MRDDKEARLSKEVSQKSEEHKRVWLKVEEGGRLALEARRIAEEENYTWIEAE